MDIFAKDMALLFPDGLPRLLDTRITAHEQYEDILCFPSVVFFFFTFQYILK